MYLTIKQVPKLSKDEILILKELSRASKNLYNEALYNIRQYFFKNNKYLNYTNNYHLLKESNNYKTLNSNMAEQILKEADGSFKSFFSLLKLKKDGKYNEKIKIPHYLDKDSYFPLVIGFIRIVNTNKLVIPYSNTYKKDHDLIEITIPPQLKDKHIKEIRIIPKLKGLYFELQYTYEAKPIDNITLSSHKYISLDIGVNNLITAVTSNGQSFIIDGKYLKSLNQWFNKRNSYLQSIHMKQIHFKGKDKISYTLNQYKLLDKRNKRINDYLSKTAKYIINYCLDNNIGNIILGYNKDIQKDTNLSKQSNQSFKALPLGKLKDKLTYLSKLYGINLILQEESYTSKASFLDNDQIPTYGKDDNKVFSGTRIKRGLYRTYSGRLINADINGSLNILKKALSTSKADDYKSIISNLCIVGHVDVPKRIRLA